MASGIYNRFKANLMNKEVDLEADTIKIALLNNSHSFTATHNTWSQVSANELANGNGYTTGGATLGGKAVTQAATTKWDATDPTWPASTLTAYHAVIYDDTHATDDLICSFDFGGAVTTVSGTLTIQFHADGIITLA
jgi:hypothetical protein